MDFIIVFFRDILDGPVYVVVAIICGILICSCIGYLAEKRINKKKEKNRYAEVAFSGFNEPIEPQVSVNPQPAPQNVQSTPPAPQVGQSVSTQQNAVGEQPKQ